MIDTALQNLLGATARKEDRLVGCEYRDFGAFEFAFHREGFVHLAGDPGHGFTNDHVETPVGKLSFGEKVGYAPGAGDRNIESFVARSLSALLQLHPAGLDIVEMACDHPCRWHSKLAAFQLAKQRLPGVLMVFGGGSSYPCDP
ncbi:hypothetical protein OG203_30835 [Nocardia sp. NBC_01499]|uniref:hypothetical protein n=1 Tax=Nocardia sp. NBC_01499 TaxID=2903597 RepID=UPI00386C7AE4